MKYNVQVFENGTDKPFTYKGIDGKHNAEHFADQLRSDTNKVYVSKQRSNKHA